MHRPITPLGWFCTRICAIGLLIPLIAVPLVAAPPNEAKIAPQATAQELLEQSGVSGGLVVHVGCGDGKFTVDLKANDRLLVLGLDQQAKHVDIARRYVHGSGLGDQVLIDSFDGSRIPCIDNLVNLLVVEDRAELSMDEVTRVLRPLGVALLRDGNSWQRVVKPWPDTIDEWTHYLHGPDNNAVAADSQVAQPFHLQWMAGPRWARHHNHLSSTSAMVSAGGRTFSIVDEGPAASLALPADWQLVARDAFNGVVLWKFPIGPWEGRLRPFRSGPVDLARRLVAVGDRVYVTPGYGKPIVALDAASGAEVETYRETEDAVEFLVDDNRLFAVVGVMDRNSYEVNQRRGLASPTPGNKRLVAIDTQSGRVLWQKSDVATSNLLPSTLCTREGRLFFHSPHELVCIDAATGQSQWQVARPLQSVRFSWSAPTLLVHDDVVLSADRAVETAPDATDKKAEIEWKVTAKSNKKGTVGELIAYSVVSGKELWRCPTAMGYNSPPDVFVTGGLVWTGAAPGRNSEDFTQGRDLHTGQVKREFETESLFSVAHHHRCYRNKATERFIVVGRTGVELIDLAEGTLDRNCWVRGACQYGVMPANGLLYAPPHSCACYIQSKLTGFCALAPKRAVTGGSTQPTGSGATDESRLETGSAYTSLGDNPPPEVDSSARQPSDWPVFRHDSGRSGRSPGSVPSDLERLWQATVGGQLTSPVVAAGKVLVAAKETHSIHALDAVSGEQVWQRIVGGLVDSPPTIDSGLAVFGCGDGWVYCLRVADGELVWRFRAAPQDLRTVVYGRVESLWPVTGSVLVRDGIVYCTAGRSSFLDGGMVLCRLDLQTGKLIGETRFDSRDPETGKQREETVDDVELPGALPDVLVDDGSYIYLRDIVLDAQGAQQDRFVPHLYCSAGLLDDSWWHRTSWLWGERNWGRASGWAVMPGIRPSGRILATDDTTVFGFGRKSVRGSTLDDHRLFRVNKSVTEIDKSIKNNNAALAANQKPANVTYHWSRDVPLAVRAMALTEPILFAAGPTVSVGQNEPRFDGDDPARLFAFSTSDGATVSSIEIESQPVFDGMALAYDRLFMANVDGTIVCYGESQ